MKKKKIFTHLFVGSMVILSISARAQNGLFISEVTDPADNYNGRFIELYNSGTEAVDFNTHTMYLSRQSNGTTTWGEVQLAGTVGAGETFVLGGSSFETVYGFPPDQQTGIITGNGNDAYVLFLNGNHTTGTIHDIYGAVNIDGTGTLWEYTDSRAVRVEGITTPRTIWDAAEWEISPANVLDTDPGTYHSSTGGDTTLQGEYSLAVQSDTIALGQPTEVSILVSELTLADNIISYQLNIGFDTSSLQYIGINLYGTIAEGGETAVNSNVAGQLSISYMRVTPLNGEGAIIKLQFNSKAADTCQISISNAWLNNIRIQDLTNGNVIIRKVNPPTAAVTYNDMTNRFADTLLITATFSEIMHEANPVHLHLGGAVTLADALMIRQSPTVYTYAYRIPKAGGNVTVSLSNGTDLWGNEVIHVPISGGTFNIIQFRPGDVDDDSIILAYDAAITLQHSVGLDPIPAIDPLPWENWRDSTANVDGIGDITAYDAGLILQFSAGVITSFPGETIKSFSMADVYLDIVADEIIFYTWGELLGFNLSTTDENNILGSPMVLNNTFMSAFNNRGTKYNLGLCTAFPPENGTAILKIPFTSSGSVTFTMLVNTEEEVVTIELVTGRIDPEKEEIAIYPNPAKDKLYINTGVIPRMDEYQLKIINQTGVTVFESRVKGSRNEIDLSGWKERGLYFVQVADSEGRTLATRKIILQ
jgi:Secretion system C-terminal sorting domain/Lamin Tail Domain